MYHLTFPYFFLFWYTSYLCNISVVFVITVVLTLSYHLSVFISNIFFQQLARSSWDYTLKHWFCSLLSIILCLFPNICPWQIIFHLLLCGLCKKWLAFLTSHPLYHTPGKAVNIFQNKHMIGYFTVLKKYFCINYIKAMVSQIVFCFPALSRDMSICCLFFRIYISKRAVS